FESGTQNAAAIQALGKGIEFINNIGIDAIRAHDKMLTNYLLENLMNFNDIIVYGAKNPEAQIGTISFNLKNMDCTAVSNNLSRDFNIATRSGYQCAALAHRTLGTENSGTIRASLSYFSTKKDIDMLINALWKIGES
ncbi:MAG: aminotransferase class V-fold PLP-dependent enzyme, partial [Oscillospiraceae bacterium]|nr:aminotransferase class V-fold PLP-dependent enzyme [Oscillospiraceae bacterium]